MKASELRIGNWVYDNPCLSSRQIDAKDILELVQMEVAGHTRFHLEPEELTSEWLERFGFEHENTIGGWSKWSNGKMRLLDMKFYFDSSEYFIRVEDVHQLQNLYFALTGEELTIKDDGKKEGKEQPEPEGAEGPAKGTLE